eukprot:525523-Pleurochrysis_carterae.AAC.1
MNNKLARNLYFELFYGSSRAVRRVHIVWVTAHGHRAPRVISTALHPAAQHSTRPEAAEPGRRERGKIRWSRTKQKRRGRVSGRAR